MDAGTSGVTGAENWLASVCGHAQLEALYRGYRAPDAGGWRHGCGGNLPCPANSRTSVGLYRRAAYAEAGTALRFHFIEAWADHPRLADAFADRLLLAWQEACRLWEQKFPCCSPPIASRAERFRLQRPPIKRPRRKRVRRRTRDAGRSPRRYLIFASSSADCGRSVRMRYRRMHPTVPIPTRSRPNIPRA